MKNYAEAIGKGILITFVFSIFSSLLGYAFRIFLSKSLAIDEFGLFYSVMAFVGLAGILTEFGAYDSLVKHLAELNARHEYKKIVSASVMVFLWRLFLSLVVFGTLILSAGYWELAYFKTDGAYLVLQLVLIENIINMGIYTYIFQGLGKFKFFAATELARILLFFAAAYALIGMGVTGVAIANLAATAIMGVLFTLIFTRQFPFFLKEMSNLLLARQLFDRQLFERIRNFGFVVWVGSLTALIGRVDILALTVFRTLGEVGLYSVAMPTAALLLIFVSPIANVLYPSISAMWAKNEAASVAKSMSVILRLSFVFMLPFSLIITAFSDYVLATIFGAKFMAASGVLSILALSMVLSALASLSLIALKAIGHPELNTKIAIVALVSNIVFNAYMVPLYGINGAAAATFLSSFIVFALSMHKLNKKIKIHAPAAKISSALMGGFSMLLIMLLAKGMIEMNDAVLEAFLISSVGVLYYALYAVQFRLITKDDFRIFLMTKIYVPQAAKKIIFRVLRD